MEINKSTQLVPLANAYSPTKTLCSIASLISGNRSSKLFRTTSTIINQEWKCKRLVANSKRRVSRDESFVFPPNFKMAPVPFSFVVRFSSEVFHRKLLCFEFSPYASFPLNRLLTEWLVSYTGCSFQGWKFVQREARCDGRLEMRKGRHELWSHGGWISTGEGFVH